MADEEKNEQTEEKADEQAPVQEPRAEAEEQQAEEPQAEEKPAEEAPAEEPKDEPPADEASAEAAPADGDAEGTPSDDEGLDWKARRRLQRSREPSVARAQRSPTDRASQRAQRRAAAAKARAAYRRKRRDGREGGTGTPPAERSSVARKLRQGRVVSDKADKTITIRIDVAHRHPTYEKIVRTSNTLHVHDERNEAGEGDLVRVVETRPLSRTKRWRLVEILEKAK